MIEPEDFDFHFNKDSHWQWVETIATPFYVADANINVVCYVVTRPMLGVCMSDITIMDRITDLWEEQAYIDNQQHMPCPESLMDFSLPNGLSFKADEPLKRHSVKYQGFDDTSFDLEVVALHEPYDINDPDMDPTAAARKDPAWDSSWSGHYDMTSRITGELIVRGKRYEVDCVDTGDRSWGPRPERDNSSVIWWHASFGEGLTIHLFTGHDIANTWELAPHISGYVLENGKTYGIVDSRGRQEYRKATPMGGILEVTDTRGKTFTLSYSTINSCHWAPYPSNTYLQASMRVVCDGNVGHGVQQMGISRAYLTRNRDAIRANT
ncbi:hypothetical protein EHM94_17885 [Marinobacter sp. NP-6]|uniref:DUF7064 domain-containing protein n=1 Tax=Marinobacter sp. NP-6 TaxID=2488666 RepID=UPI000FC9B447|nr:hypothetical protein [Marinobacter sp. NP-6]RUT76904.1 hypothetical protein EHM94_17885 [Marinobacter sp. NP-6]